MLEASLLGTFLVKILQVLLKTKIECASRAKLRNFNSIVQLDETEDGLCTVGNIEIPESQKCAFVEPLESSKGMLWSTALAEKYVHIPPRKDYAGAKQACQSVGGKLPMIRTKAEHEALKGKSYLRIL